MAAIRLDDVLTTLALKAGAEIMAVYDAGPVQADRKADDSPVTAADLAADKVISEGLAHAYPDIPAVTEEAAESHDLTPPPQYFLVDPLDGTKEFVQRRGDFTVNIALIEDGIPTAGVVYAPAKGRLFITHTERPGAASDTAQEQRVEDHRLVPGTGDVLAVTTPDNGALKIVASKSHRDQATDDYIAGFRVAEFKSAGSSLKFCLLAAGEADFYPRLGRTMEWDTAAGHAVLRAAGGIVLDKETKAPLGYGKPGWENPHFLAMAPGVEI
ncbi:MAG: 3'(2'),5'-bisphosphate nucleotidase CysQ [Pseudomonadota bacterium]